MPYNPDWVESFHEEELRLRVIFGDEILAVHHVGSTSIPGMPAKPIIDMLSVVRDINVIDGFNPLMREKGYLPRGEYGLPGRRYFIKSTELERTHHIHFYQSGSPEIERHLAFRDYLYAFPENARDYAELKLYLVDLFKGDKDAYMSGKDALIKELQTEALCWKRGS